MHPVPNNAHLPLDRRTFLVAGGVGIWGLGIPGGLGLPAIAQANNAARTAPGRKIAKSTILIWLSGGASHIDTWDLKPNAPLDYRGEFNQIATSTLDIQCCEHLPLTSRQAHHLAVLNSVGDFRRGTGDHHAGYYYNLTGHAPDPTFQQLLNARTPYPTDWPSMAATVAYKRPQHPFLPQSITLPQKPGFPEYTRPGQFAARLGMEYDPLYVYGQPQKPLDFVVPSLKLQGEISLDRLSARKSLLSSLDDARRMADQSLAAVDYGKQQSKAFSLLTSTQTRAAFDIASEPESVRANYGPGINAMSMLMARRLVEAEVPFISVFWNEDLALEKKLGCKSGGGWDTHGNNFGCLKKWLLPEFDRPFAALLDDLHQRNLLDETLVLVTSEMGRKPKIGDVRSGGTQGAGRDHWPQCMTVLLGGGGIRGGQKYGTSDKLAEFPADNPVAPEDIAKTLYHAMGLPDLHAVDRQGRPFDLLEEGKPILSLF